MQSIIDSFDNLQSPFVFSGNDRRNCRSFLDTVKKVALTASGFIILNLGCSYTNINPWLANGAGIVIAIYSWKKNRQQLPECKINTGEPRGLDFEVAACKMLKNARKAILEAHETAKKREKYGVFDSTYFKTYDEYLKQFQKWKRAGSFIADPSVLPLEVSGFQANFNDTLVFRYFEAETIGKRLKMEDAHFFLETKTCILTGLFDGHGGDKIANLAANKFKNKFLELLRSKNGNVHQAFEILNHKIHLAALKIGVGGTTAVLCYIDKHSRMIYTATLGDSEARLYRRDEGCKMIPLSCVRDWGSKKDAFRYAKIKSCPSLYKYWTEEPHSKDLRYEVQFPNFNQPHALNVSRALGDKMFCGTPDKPGVVHKMKITMNQLQPNDVLVLGCDGLWDYVPDEYIIQMILFTGNESDLASILVNKAVNYYGSTDNVTSLVLRIN